MKSAHTRHAKKRFAIVVLVCAGLAIISTAILLLQMDQTEHTPRLPSSTSALEHIDTAQKRLTNSGDLDEYRASLQSEELTLVNEGNIHSVPEVDWKTHDIIAIQYGVYAARSFKTAQLETVENTDTIVITLKEPSSQCSSIQANELHAFFIAVPKGKTTYPTALRIEQTKATECIK